MLRKILCLCLLTIFVVGCGGDKEKTKTKKKGFTPPPKENLFTIFCSQHYANFEPFMDGVNAATDEFYCDVQVFRTTDVDGNELISQILENDFDKTTGVAIGTNYPLEVEPIIDKAKEKNLPLVFFNYDMSILGLRRDAFIEVTQYDIGMKAGEAMNRLVYGATAEIEIWGINPSSGGESENIRGFKDSIAKNIIIKKTVSAGDDPSVWKTLLKNSLKKNPEPKGILVLDASMADVFSSVVEELNLEDVRIVSTEISNDLLSDFKSKNIDTALGVQYHQVGYTIIQVLDALVRGATDEIVIPEDGKMRACLSIVTPENIEQYRMKLLDMGIIAEFE